jgi:hypothetical protein
LLLARERLPRLQRKRHYPQPSTNGDSPPPVGS